MPDRYCSGVDEHFAEEAVLVAALGPDDQARKTADDHAAACAPCREALKEGRALLVLLRRTIAQDVERRAGGNVG